GMSVDLSATGRVTFALAPTVSLSWTETRPPFVAPTERLRLPAVATGPIVMIPVLYLYDKVLAPRLSHPTPGSWSRTAGGLDMCHLFGWRRHLSRGEDEPRLEERTDPAEHPEDARPGLAHLFCEEVELEFIER